MNPLFIAFVPSPKRPQSNYKLKMLRKAQTGAELSAIEERTNPDTNTQIPALMA